jgi:hypothetical protein
MFSQNQATNVSEPYYSVSGLGPRHAVFRITANNGWISALIGTILVAGAGLFIIYAVFDTSVQVARYGPVVVVNTAFLPLVIALLLLLPGLLAIIKAITNWNKYVIVFDQGLGYSENNKIKTWYWKDVEWFYVSVTKHYNNGIHTGNTNQYTLKKVDGTELKLDNKFERIEILGQLIGQKVTPYQYINLLNKIHAGQTVKLGRVSIHKDFLTINKKTYTWDEVDTVEIQDGYAKIKKRGGGWFSGASAPVSSIPNIDALLTVLARIVKVNTAY